MSLIEDTVSSITGQDSESRAAALKRLESLTMPHWALGQLMDLALDLAGITGSPRPSFPSKSVVVMAADHGIAARGTSLYPIEVTRQMVYNFVRGGAGINAIASVSGARVIVADMGIAGERLNIQKENFIDARIAPGTRDFLVQPAMTLEQAIQSIESGIRIFRSIEADTDLLGTGDMGIGNTTSSSAIVSVLTGLPPADVTGRGTGIDDERLSLKTELIEKAIRARQPDRNDGLSVLSSLGGFEIGGIAGLILGAASAGIPVLIDGFISTAGALIAHSLSQEVAQYLIAAHMSVETGHKAMLDLLELSPLLDLDFRLGEGTGAAMAMPLVDAAARLLTDVATFEEASVSRNE